MCIKRIYYNTYGDGTEDVTERIDTCRPGKVCGHPETRNYERQFRFTKLRDPAAVAESPSSLADRKPTPYHMDNLMPPTIPGREAKSPSPNGSGASGRRASAVYMNGTKVADLGGEREHGSRRSRNRDVSPDRARVPGMKRYNTMPAAEPVVVQDDDRHHRHRSRRNRSREIPLGPFGVMEDLGRRSSRDRGSPSPPRHRHGAPRDPYRRYEPMRPAPSVVYVDDEREAREQRRRQRRDAERRGMGYSTGDYTAAADIKMPVAPEAPAAPRKALRWQDQVEAAKAAQNAQIASRPKVGGAAAGVVHQGGEVKGILKHATAGADPYDELRRSVYSMDINGSDERARGRAHERKSKGEDDDAYWDRLRGRFDEPRERERKRRSRVYYPGEGLYKYI